VGVEFGCGLRGGAVCTRLTGGDYNLTQSSAPSTRDEGEEECGWWGLETNLLLVVGRVSCEAKNPQT
jgi:hypothetical protein